MEIYDELVDIFVVCFVGVLGMNFVDGKLECDD